MTIIGIIAIYNASVVEAVKDFNDRFFFVRQQITWLVIASIISLVVSIVPISLIKKLSGVALIVSITLLVLVLIPGIGSKYLGARRWLEIGPVVLQPSEIAKIVVVVYLSYWLQKAQKLIHFLTLIAVFASLIMLQPDLGTAIILTGTSVLMFYLSGAPLSDFTKIIAFGLVAILLLIIASPYRLNRVKTYLDPTSDPLGKAYHVNQILYGLGSGGVTGVGLGMSRQKYAFLPEATTDSIFVVIAEEFGFIGSTVFISILVYFVYRCFRIALETKDVYLKMLASGITMIYLLQMVVNLGSMTSLFPLTGVPLPFISYGGSSLTTNFIALGLLMNISRQNES